MTNFEGREIQQGSAKKSLPKRASPKLPVELLLMVYEHIFIESIVEIDDTGRRCVRNKALREFTKNRRNCRLVFGQHKDVIAGLVTYRVADPTILRRWLSQRPKYRTLVRRLEIRSGYRWNCNHQLCGFIGTSDGSLVTRHTPPWFKVPDMALKRLLPRLQEVRLEIRFETGYLVGFCTLTIQDRVYAETRQALDEWEATVAAWNPGLRVVAQSRSLERAVSRFNWLDVYIGAVKKPWRNW